jgi:hypothetical protein
MNMTCPGCGAVVAKVGLKEQCACGFPVGELQGELRIMYILASSFFVSALIYGVIVVVTKVPVKEPGSQHLFVHMLGAIAAAESVGIALWALAARIPESMTPAETRRRLTMQLAFSESVVIYGLIAYFVTGKIDNFVPFLAAGLILFALVGSRIPRLGLAIRRHLYDEWQASK